MTETVKVTGGNDDRLIATLCQLVGYTDASDSGYNVCTMDMIIIFGIAIIVLIAIILGICVWRQKRQK